MSPDEIIQPIQSLVQSATNTIGQQIRDTNVLVDTALGEIPPGRRDVLFSSTYGIQSSLQRAQQQLNQIHNQFASTRHKIQETVRKYNEELERLRKQVHELQNKLRDEQDSCSSARRRLEAQIAVLRQSMPSLNNAHQQIQQSLAQLGKLT